MKYKIKLIISHLWLLYIHHNHKMFHKAIFVSSVLNCSRLSNEWSISGGPKLLYRSLNYILPLCWLSRFSAPINLRQNSEKRPENIVKNMKNMFLINNMAFNRVVKDSNCKVDFSCFDFTSTLYSTVDSWNPKASSCS